MIDDARRRLPRHASRQRTRRLPFALSFPDPALPRSNRVEALRPLASLAAHSFTCGPEPVGDRPTSTPKSCIRHLHHPDASPGWRYRSRGP